MDGSLTTFVGIDVSKHSLDGGLLPQGNTFSVAYDQNGFLEIVKRFVLARRFAKVRVLLSDSGRLLRDNNRFIAMGRRLTSCIDIRPAVSGSKQRACAYLIADDRAIVYRVHSDRWDGVADLNNPPIARQYLDEFDEIWHASSTDELTRQAAR